MVVIISTGEKLLITPGAVLDTYYPILVLAAILTPAFVPRLAKKVYVHDTRRLDIRQRTDETSRTRYRRLQEAVIFATGSIYEIIFLLIVIVASHMLSSAI